MKEFEMFCGLSGSGKTRYIKDYVERLRKEGYNVEVLSSDAIREYVFGDINDQTHNKEVFNIIHKRIAEWTAEVDDINDILIIDATNLTRKNRMAMLNIARQTRTTDQIIRYTVYVMATPFEKCVANDATRDRTVGRDVIYKQLCKFSVPQKFEGWDNVNFIHAQGRDFCFPYEIMEKMIGFDQNNPHHKYTLFEHCMKARYIAEREYFWKEFAVAAQYHDIGKLFTKTTDENGISHYYNHANVSAYYMMVNIDVILAERNSGDLNKMYILFLIENHMIIRDIDKHCPQKYRKLWGDYRYEDVLRFSKIDEEATGIDNQEKHNEDN